MLSVKTGGFEFRRFKAYEIDSSLDTLADGFSFALGNPAGVNAGRLQEGALVQIFEGNTQLLIGEIDTVEESSDIRVKGRDLMVRAIENDVEHKEEETTIHPAGEIERLAKKVGIDRIDVSLLPSPLQAIDFFTLEAGESSAEVMLRLAEAGGFKLWMDRLGVLHLAKLDFKQAPPWSFFNTASTANCEMIKRFRSAANLKSEIWAFLEIYDKKANNLVLKYKDQALIDAGLKRKKTILDPVSWKLSQAKVKLVKLMEELKQGSKEWQVSYGGNHVRENGIPEIAKTASITSIYSGVTDLKALIVSVRLKKDEKGTKTELVLREAA